MGNRCSRSGSCRYKLLVQKGNLESERSKFDDEPRDGSQAPLLVRQMVFQKCVFFQWWGMVRRSEISRKSNLDCILQEDAGWWGEDCKN